MRLRQAIHATRSGDGTLRSPVRRPRHHSCAATVTRRAAGTGGAVRVERVAPRQGALARPIVTVAAVQVASS